MRIGSKKRCHRFSSRRLRTVKVGAAVVEFASIAPVMILFTFGLIEIGRVSMVKQTVMHATREGARVAVRPNATTQDVINQINQELTTFDLQGAIIETIPAALEAAEPGANVTVRVRLDMNHVSWVPNYFLFSEGEMLAETVMRRESTN
ncbi:MAG: TadE/TadG family type IV pilus assembly protein [Rubripirellula sp.]